VLLLAAGSAQAHAVNLDPETCGSTAQNKVIKGELTVPPEAACTLIKDTVEGNLSIGEGARLFAGGTDIKGNLSSNSAKSMSLVASEVDGNVSIDATSGTEGAFGACGTVESVCLLGTTLKPDRFLGNVSITNTSPGGAVIANSLVAQNLTCTGNAFATNLGLMDTVSGQEFGQCVGL
jgi:hypothetical protein